ncbi:ROK family transcriptional regulator [Chitinophaga sp. GCM10012297]|uniref:ROK family transcriptional regulator n=1 Tax=Chitinophaga chungangae TaxID=2821488 RepID=A0ABS3Y8J9_9BACT|nr:ROK family transcriptional regulator [Chitinophaga chungangae]MBO9150995.1 ROK family transcriptional regulator [Chitinophaga chungangae]
MSTFFEELNNETLGGVAYKNLSLKKKIIAYFTNINNATIADLAKELNASTPKVTHLLNELLQEGLVNDYGKVDSTGGRKPNLYGMAPDAGFFIGVEVKKYHINIGLLDFKRNLVKFSEKIPYELQNTAASLDELCKIILRFTDELPVGREKILGVGVNLSGRINYATGYSYSFFHFDEEPLSRVIEARIGIRTFLENDSRAMAYGEFSSGTVNNEKNVLFVNLDHGIGLGILINGQLYYGKSGFAGEFGHIPFFNNEVICHCGKKGCLETEASGQALVRKFQEKIKAGSSSSVMRKLKKTEQITLADIIHAANNDDMLAIELVAEVGEKLGKGIAMLINLFNPELVILGGSIATTGDYIRLPIKSAINKYSLSLVNNDTQLVLSRLGEKAGIIGACLLVRNKLLYPGAG